MDRREYIHAMEVEVEVVILPFMAILHPAKGKVRPVLDFRQLNQRVQ